MLLICPTTTMFHATPALVPYGINQICWQSADVLLVSINNAGYIQRIVGYSPNGFNQICWRLSTHCWYFVTSYCSKWYPFINALLVFWKMLHNQYDVYAEDRYGQSTYKQKEVLHKHY
ncbi:unnamed protein product [Caenorhabditis angaria]|uniref:Uncharacterized protein n=1 Tax=Caenorhabditis angaria TaxID=860376 RepID=A0A9P1N770_9PELO|nr:unnamed protein product [Caenorhabditis angaria]CAI5450598.1 unnamed protein product [Caenorhabditis angaria]